MKYLLAALLMSACGIVKDPSTCVSADGSSQVATVTTAATVSGSAVFTQSVAPFLVRCQTCHSIANGQPPYLGDQDLKISYLAALGMMNFTDLSKARLWTKLQQGHQSALNLQSGKESDDFKAALLTWSLAESPIDNTTQKKCQITTPGAVVRPTPTQTGTPSPQKILTTAVTMPILALLGTTLYTALPFQYVRVPLDGAGISGAYLELGLRRFNDPSDASPGYIQISSPRLFTPTRNVRVTGIIAHIIGRNTSGNADHSSNAYFRVDSIVAPPATTPTNTPPYAWAPLATNSSTMELVANTGNQLQFQFSSISFTTDPAITPPPAGATEAQVYASTIDPILTGRCYPCHNTGGTGVGAFSLANGLGVAGRRLNVLNIVTRTNPDGSTLIVYGTNSNAMHGGGVRLSVATEITAIKTWIGTTAH